MGGVGSEDFVGVGGLLVGREGLEGGSHEAVDCGGCGFCEGGVGCG